MSSWLFEADTTKFEVASGGSFSDPSCEKTDIDFRSRADAQVAGRITRPQVRHEGSTSVLSARQATLTATLCLPARSSLLVPLAYAGAAEVLADADRSGSAWADELETTPFAAAHRMRAAVLCVLDSKFAAPSQQAEAALIGHYRASATATLPATTQ